MGRYDTTLSQADETAFTMWFSQMKQDGNIVRDDNGDDYDYRGYWKNEVEGKGATANAQSHFPDTYKKPNHPTFSIESQYATGINKLFAGYWDGDEYQQPLMRYDQFHGGF